MIDNPFWKVFFKKQNLGIIYLPRNVQKNNKKVKGHVYAFPVVYTTVNLVQQLQIIFRLVLCIAHRCDCNKRNKDPVCTYCIRCKHTNDHRISGFDCNQVPPDILFQNYQFKRQPPNVTQSELSLNRTYRACIYYADWFRFLVNRRSWLGSFTLKSKFTCHMCKTM